MDTINPSTKTTDFDKCIENVKALNNRVEAVFIRLRGASGRLLGSYPNAESDTKGVTPMPQGKIFEIVSGLSSLNEVVARLESFAIDFDNSI